MVALLKFLPSMVEPVVFPPVADPPVAVPPVAEPLLESPPVDVLESSAAVAIAVIPKLMTSAVSFMVFIVFWIWVVKSISLISPNRIHCAAWVIAGFIKGRADRSNVGFRVLCNFVDT